jgi:predicted transglutaminase-like cysteine proteinase
MIAVSLNSTVAFASTLSDAIPIAPSIPEGEVVLAPLAFVVFCQTYSEECPEKGSARPVRLTFDVWQLMVVLNALVNKSIRQVPEPPGQDVWNRGVTQGDCDEFATEKRFRLARGGLPMPALSLTEVEDAAGEGHLVLTVRTDHGAFVLDNIRDGILPWDKTGYRFIKIQSMTNPREWMSVGSDASSHDVRGHVPQSKELGVLP